MEPLRSLEKEGPRKNAQKCKENRKTKKARKSKKASIGGSGASGPFPNDPISELQKKRSQQNGKAKLRKNEISQ